MTASHLTDRNALAHDHIPAMDAFGVIPDQIDGHLRQIAETPSTVLLSGETGSGKTYLARVIHQLSPRRHLPFLVVNCASLSESLIESELFGHIRGAFTGAERDRVGKLQEVGDGTLLLDEVDCLTPAVQAKILRVIEERVFEAVGSNRPEAFRARLIVASNRDLAAEVAAGRFRGDLYYRVNVISLELPPLRERRQDIPTLVTRFLQAESDPHAPRLDEPALHALVKYDWPGNIRELRNVLERARIFARGGRITPAELPAALTAGPAPMPLPAFLGAHSSATPAPVSASGHAGAGEGVGGVLSLAESKSIVERDQILRALKAHGNNRSMAARTLGISRVCLYKKIHRYGIPLKQPLAG